MATAATVTGISHIRSTVKRDTIHEIEKQIQKLWADLKVFEADAPSDSTDK
jgi:leucyl-tRNA synthetase